MEGYSQENKVWFEMYPWLSCACVRLISCLPPLGSLGGVGRLSYYRTVPPTPLLPLLYLFYKHTVLKTPIARSHFSCVIEEWGLNSDHEFLGHGSEGSSSHVFSYIKSS